MPDSLWTHGLQHSRLPCPSPTPRACSNSCPLSQWYHPTISSSVGPFSSCLQSFPTSGSFPRSQFFTSGGQSIGASASVSVLPMNIHGWFPNLWWAAVYGVAQSQTWLKWLSSSSSMIISSFDIAYASTLELIPMCVSFFNQSEVFQFKNYEE